MALRWYIVHAYSNYEYKVKASLEERVEMMGLQEKFGDILVTAIPQIGLGLLLVEIALVISSSENRRLGDRIAGTLVISRSTSQDN